MYQCSKKERQTYPIRPHHGMCLAFFIGNGYSTGFTAHMQEMLELFTKGADVCLTVKTDEICSACPNNSQGICEAAEKVKRYDNAVLAECGLKEGQKLAFPEFTVGGVNKAALAEKYREPDIQHFAESGSLCFKDYLFDFSFFIKSPFLKDLVIKSFLLFRNFYSSFWTCIFECVFANVL